jgi:hypothetical protein
MLSFMREQEPQNASERPAPGPGPENGPAADASGAQEYLTVASNRQTLRRSTIILAALVGIGLVCLLVMIRRSQPQAVAAASTGDPSKIEAAISRLTGVRSEMAGRMDEVVQKFYQFSDVVQVKVSELSKNPFEVEGFAQDLKTTTVVDDPEAQAELIRRQKIEQQAKTLKLLSVMRSEQGDCCMINDAILREGDIIEGFKIVKIGGTFVELAWPSSGALGSSTSPTDEMKTVLKLSQ